MLADVDVAVLGLGLPDGYDGDLISELREVNPRAKALVLSESLDAAEIARAVDNGAAASLHKMATTTSSSMPYGAYITAPPRRPSMRRATATST
jgi:DNA-binding NarL/FixJ family response regulator